MRRLAQVTVVALLVLLPKITVASPAQDANAVVERWSAAYNSNDPEAMVSVIGRTRSSSEP